MADCCCNPCALSCNSTGDFPDVMHALAYDFFLNGFPYQVVDGLYTITRDVPTNAWSFTGPPAGGAGAFGLNYVVISLQCKGVITPRPFGAPTSRFNFFIKGVRNLTVPNDYGPFNFFDDINDQRADGVYSYETFTSCAPPLITYAMNGALIGAPNNPNFSVHGKVDILA